MNAGQEKATVEDTSNGEKIATYNAHTQKSENLETAVKTEENTTEIKLQHVTDKANGNSDGVECGGNSSGPQDCDSNGSAKIDEVVSTEPNDKESQMKNANDPYAQIDRDDFTSEKFKIEIRGLPKFYGYGELNSFLNDKLKLSSHKVQMTRKNCPWVYFKNEEDKQAALKTLNRLTWKGRMLTALTAKSAPDPLAKKRKLEHESGNVEKKPRISDDEKLKNSTTPYWNLSYEEQLKSKYEYVQSIMCNLADLIVGINPMLTLWIRRQKAKYHGMACELLDIRKSPICDGYRNKCEFTIGINEETKERMVGFRLGHVGVGPIDSLKHIPQRMKETVKVFEKFVQASSKEPYNPETHTGHWRFLTLRLTTLGELMAVVVVNSREVSKAELDSARKEVKDFFEKGEGKALNVNSLFFHAVRKREAGKEPPMEHILGATHITESLLGLKFRISPEAFFPVNTLGAGVLYSSVNEMIVLNPSTTIVDVCCGSGTRALSLAKKCRQVLGLEAVAAAIEDAKVNASMNSITNCTFFNGRADGILSSVLSRAKGKSVYAIVDPPRSGLQLKDIIALRSARVVEKIVYVSCDPSSALKNFVDLARQTSKTYYGYPLVPICAVPVDMFPHTAHCEVVILFHRVNPINLPKSMPAKKSDAALLSGTLTKSLSKEPKSDESSKKDKGNKEGNKEKPVSSEYSSTNNKFSSIGRQQGNKFKKTLLSAGNYSFSHTVQSSTSKASGKQGFGPNCNASHSSINDTSDWRRGQKRAFENERPSKAVWQLRREKSPPRWLGDGKRRWKEDKSFMKNPVSIWKDAPPTHFTRDRTLPEEKYLVPESSSGRSGWKDVRLERESRGWNGSSPIKHKWQGMEPRRRGNISPIDEMVRRRQNISPIDEVVRRRQNISPIDEVVRRRQNISPIDEVVRRRQNISPIDEVVRRRQNISPIDEVVRRRQNISPIDEVVRRRQNISPIDEVVRRRQNISPIDEVVRRRQNISPIDEVVRRRQNISPIDEVVRRRQNISPIDEVVRRRQNISPIDEMVRRRENISPIDEVRRREGWRRGLRDEETFEPKRLRDERGGMVERPMVERRKLMREDEQLAASRRDGRDSGGYGSFEGNAKGNWPQTNDLRLVESHVTSEPVWQESRIVQNVEDGIRVDIRRLDIDRERSPIQEIRLSPWNDMRARREDFDNHMGHGMRFQEMRSERRQVRDESPDQCWMSGGMVKRSENLEEEESYRMRRKFSDLDVECDRPEFGIMGDHSSRKSCERMGGCDCMSRLEEQSSFDMHPGRRMEMKGDGGNFDSQRSKVMLMEMETMIPRHVDQIDNAPRELPPYRDAREMPTVSYRDQRIGDERPYISPERMIERTAIDMSYRKTDSDNYRRSDEIPSSHFSKNEREMPDPYMSSKGGMGSHDKKYESNLLHRDYDHMGKGSRGQSEHDLMAMRKVEMINQPIVMGKDYAIEVCEPRRSVGPSDILLANSKSQMYQSDRFTSHDKEVVKNIQIQKDTLSQLKPWSMGGHPSVMTKSSSPVRMINATIDMFTRGRSIERGGGSWARDRSPDKIVGWRDDNKVSSARGYFSREESNNPETIPSGISYHLSERCDKRAPRLPSTSISREIPTLSPQNIEKSFSFSSARAAIGQHMYNTDDINMAPSMSDVSLYPRKAPEQYGSCQAHACSTMQPTNTSVDPIDRMGGMPFRQHLFSHEAPTFKNASLQGSMKMSSLPFKLQVPTLSQITTINFGQGVTSTVANALPSVSASSPWSNAGISPWEQGHRHHR